MGDVHLIRSTLGRCLFIALGGILTLSSCKRQVRDNIPIPEVRGPQTDKADPIVALYNGTPLRWSIVSAKVRVFFLQFHNARFARRCEFLEMLNAVLKIKELLSSGVTIPQGLADQRGDDRAKDGCDKGKGINAHLVYPTTIISCARPAC